MSKIELKPEQTLSNVLAFDIGKRYEILREECHHLLQSTRFRLEAGALNNRDTAPQRNDSVQAFSARLSKAAQLLQDECLLDIEELDSFWIKRKIWLEEEELEAKRGYGGASLTGSASVPRESLKVKFQLHHVELAWHAKMMFKASLIAERIGDLHDRLAQLLQRTNPDHPDPTLRRRTEQGQIDKYLTEQTRWVHRDIARFAITAGMAYPYDQIPATFQFWDYDYTSRHHSFLPSEGYDRWTSWNRSGRERSHSPRKFASLRLSYWMTERVPLHPIIGHEIAHQVLRDSFGHLLSHPQLEQDRGQIAHLFRRLSGCAEKWLSCRPNVNSSAEAETLSVEIVCDLLAAVRYRHGYAYAWILEMVGDEKLAHLFSDETSMLQRFWSGEPGVEEALEKIHKKVPPGSKRLPQSKLQPFWSKEPGDKVTLEQMRKEFLWGTKRLQQSIPRTYYRGAVLLTFLRETTRPGDDPTGDELCSALEFFVRAILDLYVGGDSGRLPFELAFAADLASKVCRKSGISIRPNWTNRSKFLRLAGRFWRPSWRYPFSAGQPLSNAPLNHQLLTKSFRTILKTLPKKIVGCPTEAFDWPTVRVMTDAAWRIEWLMEKHGPPTDDLKNDVRALLFLGADDYIYRTTNPASLLAAIGVKGIPDSPNSNTIDDYDFGRVYDLASVNALDRFLRMAGNGSESIHVSYLGTSASIEKVHLEGYLDSLLVGEDDLQKWFHLSEDKSLPEYFHLELIRAQNYLLTAVEFRGELSESSQESSLRSVDGHQGSVSVGTRGGVMKLKYQRRLSSDLLGRYDQIVLASQGHDGDTLGWWDEAAKKGEQGSSATQEKKEMPYVSRVKKLIRFDEMELCTDADRFIAVVLVSLRWEAFRSLVGRWLATESWRKKDSNKRLGLNMFLSDGWEDFVLLAHVPKGMGNAYTGVVHEFFDLVRKLNKHPLIKATESIFGSAVLRKYTGDRMRLRFVCRFGEGKSENPGFKRIVDDAKERGWITEARNLSGNKDMELVVNPSSPTCVREALHTSLHSDQLSDWRVETRVSWIGSNDGIDEVAKEVKDVL